MKSRFLPTLMAAVLSGASSLHAHHGQEFFLLYDAQVQKPMHGILQGNFSFIDEGTDDSLGLSPSLSLGILPRTAFNLRADFTEEASENWAYRSIEPGIQFDLTPRDLKLPVRFGLALSYQFSEGGGRTHQHWTTDLAGGSVAHVHDGETGAHSHSSAGAVPHDHSTHYHPPAPVSSGSGGGVPDQGPDGLTPEELAAMEAENAAAQAAANAQQQAAAQAAAAAAARRQKAAQKAAAAEAKAQRKAESSHDHAHGEEGGHSHSGSIHNHDDNLFTARLIFEADLTPDTLLVGNLISVLPEGGSAEWGYAVGVRHRFHPRFAMGIEALGDFDSKGHQEVLGAVFFEPMHHVLLKVGVGTGLTAVSPDATIRAGVLWMF